MIDKDDSENFFDKRATRATLAWFTTGMITLNVVLLGWILQNLVGLQTRVAVIEGSRFTNDNAEKMRQDIDDVRSGYKESFYIIGGKMDLLNQKLSILERQLTELNKEMKRNGD